MKNNYKIKVLIIDDDKEDDVVDNMQDFVRKNFKESDCQIINDIKYDSDIIFRHNPDIIIVDIALTKKDEKYLDKIKPSGTTYNPNTKLSGILYCIKIKSNFPNIPVLLASKHYSEHIVTQVIEANADGFLYKRTLKEGHFIASLTTMLHRYKTKDVYFYKKLINLLEDKEKNAWEKKHIKKALDAFFSHSSTTRRLSSLWCELSSFIERLLPPKIVNRLIQVLIDAESLMLASNPKMRDHVLHAGNVFWMGYYLLNSIPQFKNPKKLPGANKFLYEESELEPFEQLNIVWMLSALLHDIGYINEQTNKIEKKINNLYSLFGFSIETNEIEDGDENQVQSVLRDFLSKFNSDGQILNTAIGSITNSSNGKKMKTQKINDHGIASASALITLLNKENKKALLAKPEILHMIASIALHNLPKWNEEHLSKEYGLIKLNIGTLPCAWLLAYCDELQNWSRETESAMVPSDHNVTDFEKILRSAYINNSVLNLLEFADSENFFNIELNIGIQYMLMQGTNPDIACKQLTEKINAWKRDKKDIFTETLMLQDLISTKIKHWIPNKEKAIPIVF